MQPVAGENRNAVPVDRVQRRPASPEGIVVHGRQIVVNKRIGVNQLDRARRWQRQPKCVGALDGLGSALVRGGRFGRGDHEHRAQALAAGKHAVPHRFADDVGTDRRLRQPAVQGFVHLHADTPQEFGE